MAAVFFLFKNYHMASTFEDYLRLQSRCQYLLCYNFANRGNIQALLSSARTSKLRGIQLNACVFESNFGKILFEELKDSIHLEELTFFRAKLTDAGFEGIGLLLQHSSSLVALRLISTDIVRTTFLTESLRVNTTLKYLRIQDGKLTQEGIIGLARGLEDNIGLEQLWLSNLGLGDAGAIALARALEVNSHLLSLSLDRNTIKSSGGIALGRCLAKNVTLRNLNLQHNSLDDEVAQVFADVLGRNGNRSLRKLTLNWNYIGKENLITLEDTLKTNTSIEELWIRYPGTDIQKRINTLLKERRDQRSKIRLDAFSKATGSEMTAPWLRSKLMVVGRGAAGKTNTVRSLLGLQFNPEWDSTVGITLTEVATKSGARWKKTQHNDFANNFVHRLAVESMEEAPLVNRESLKQKSTTSRSADVLTATHTIGSQTEDKSNEGGEVKESAKMKSDDASFQYKEELFMAQEDSKDAIRMSVWDYGGQKVFYTLHHLFLTQYGVYLIVFNMTKLLDDVDKASEYLLFWLNSIKLHAPNAPVLLVGTFLDMLTDAKTQNVDEGLRNVAVILDKLCVGFDQVCPFEDFVFCPTSNKDKSGITSLRKAVERETRSADFVQTPVSLKWMRALDILAQTADRAWMKVSKLREELKSVGIQREEEMEKMLCLFHELGVVLYFSSSVQLKEVVIWKPEWLLDKLSLVIRDKEIHDYDTAKIEKVQLTLDLNCFLQNGIASRDLLEFLWEKSQVDYLLELMRHLLLLSTWSFSEEEQYLVPSMLSAVDLPTKIDGVQFRFVFEFLPQGVFERMCCLCVAFSSSLPKAAEPRLLKTSGIVDLGDKGLVQVDIREGNIINVAVAKKTEAIDILDFFVSIMRRIQRDFMHGGLNWQVLVEHGDIFVQYQQAKERRLEPWVRNKATRDDAVIDKFLDL